VVLALSAATVMINDLARIKAVLGRFPLGIRDRRRGASEQLGRFGWMSVVCIRRSASWLCEHFVLSPSIATTPGNPPALMNASG
jgi:hypothetical protein